MIQSIISRRAFQVMLVLAAGFAVLLLLNWTRPGPERRDSGDSVEPVQVIRAEAHTTKVSIRAYGTARAKIDLRMAAKVPGEIVFMASELREGSFFRRGATLLRIDPRSYELAVQRLEAQVRQAEIALERLEREKENLKSDLKLAQDEADLAERDLGRAQELVRRGTQSQAVLDQAQTAWIASRKKVQTIENQLALWPSSKSAAQAALGQLKAQLADAALNLEHTHVVAPFNGRVAARLVEVGQFVSIGAPLAEIYDPSVMEVRLDLPLQDFQWIDTTALRGNIQPADAPPAEVLLHVGSRTHRWRGSVTRIEGRIEQATRTVGIVVEVSNESTPSSPADDSLMIPGAFLEVELEGRQLEGVITLPRGAINQRDMVHISDNGRLATRPVSVLRVDEGIAYIDGGIRPGDLVIISPLGAPVEGMALAPMVTSWAGNSAVSGSRSSSEKAP